MSQVSSFAVSFSRICLDFKAMFIKKINVSFLLENFKILRKKYSNILELFASVSYGTIFIQNKSLLKRLWQIFLSIK